MQLRRVQKFMTIVCCPFRCSIAHIGVHPPRDTKKDIVNLVESAGVTVIVALHKSSIQVSFHKTIELDKEALLSEQATVCSSQLGFSSMESGLCVAVDES